MARSSDPIGHMVMGQGVIKLSGPLVSGTRTYYSITCLHVLIQFSHSGLLTLFTCSCTAVVCYALVVSFVMEPINLVASDRSLGP